MTQRYNTAFSKLQSHNQKAFIPFTMLGWPNRQRCFETIKLMIDEGATALELGIAFSDPVADGAVIQAAAFETLASGFSTSDAFALIAKARQYKNDVPIGILTYFNIVCARGVERFMEQCRIAGVDSVLVADLTPESAEEIAKQAKDAGISLVFTASPVTSSIRLKKISEHSSAYVYVVSRLGITGSQEQHDDKLEQLLKTARTVTQLPLCVGFGISSPDAAKRILELGADGVITGSKIIEIIRDDSKDLAGLKEYLQAMHNACRQPIRT
jgi:tryptophan synthase alpha chain